MRLILKKMYIINEQYSVLKQRIAFQLYVSQGHRMGIKIVFERMEKSSNRTLLVIFLLMTGKQRPLLKRNVRGFFERQSLYGPDSCA